MFFFVIYVVWVFLYYLFFKEFKSVYLLYNGSTLFFAYLEFYDYYITNLFIYHFFMYFLIISNTVFVKILFFFSMLSNEVFKNTLHSSIYLQIASRLIDGFLKQHPIYIYIYTSLIIICFYNLNLVLMREIIFINILCICFGFGLCWGRFNKDWGNFWSSDIIEWILLYLIISYITAKHKLVFREKAIYNMLFIFIFIYLFTYLRLGFVRSNHTFFFINKSNYILFFRIKYLCSFILCYVMLFYLYRENLKLSLKLHDICFVQLAYFCIILYIFKFFSNKFDSFFCVFQLCLSIYICLLAGVICGNMALFDFFNIYYYQHLLIIILYYFMFFHLVQFITVYKYYVNNLWKISHSIYNYQGFNCIILIFFQKLKKYSLYWLHFSFIQKFNYFINSYYEMFFTIKLKNYSVYAWSAETRNREKFLYFKHWFLTLEGIGQRYFCA